MEQTNFSEEEPKREPLVATLVISPAAQDFFNQLRQQHFPPERNYLRAHLTLFHALPDEPWIVEDLEKLAQHQPQFGATALHLVSLGFGTAFKIVSPELPALHQELQKRWAQYLTSQDKQKRNFHITVQNKVEPAAAKKLLAELSDNFEPFSFAVTGISLWRYKGGPWEFITTVPFLGSTLIS
ncbi:2'-5' RNA ligase family protein [Dyadobacter crusticola]|uniref:2'-5' RNA ligase family protein n=1 Tax=Dyadobacter crusticola TaxID=292407 RepID=UPI000691C2AE|nr:2'-5' RNA ligase family protein [Dyadobacter crusticola]